MTINKSTLGKAKKWADRVKSFDHGQMEGNAPAAAEVIRDLPDEWIDAGKLRDLSWKYLAFAEDAEPEGEKGKARATLYRNFAGILEALLPAPAPQVEIRLGAWAMHPEHGKVLITSARVDRDGEVRVHVKDSSSAVGTSPVWVAATDLSPLPDTHDDSAPKQESNYQGTLNSSPDPLPDTHDDSDKGIDFPEELGNNYVAGEHPNPEESVEDRIRRQGDQKPQPGEAWLIRTKSGECREAVLDNEGDWNGTYDHGGYHCWRKDVTPLRRLVPATEPRELTSEADYAACKRDTIVRRPGIADAAYEKWGHDEWRSAFGTRHTDREMAKYSGPRTVLWEPK